MRGFVACSTQKRTNWGQNVRKYTFALRNIQPTRLQCEFHRRPNNILIAFALAITTRIVHRGPTASNTTTMQIRYKFVRKECRSTIGMYVSTHSKHSKEFVQAFSNSLSICATTGESKGNPRKFIDNREQVMIFRCKWSGLLISKESRSKCCAALTSEAAGGA